MVVHPLPTGDSENPLSLSFGLGWSPPRSMIEFLTTVLGIRQLFT